MPWTLFIPHIFYIDDCWNACRNCLRKRSQTLMLKDQIRTCQNSVKLIRRDGTRVGQPRITPLYASRQTVITRMHNSNSATLSAQRLNRFHERSEHFRFDESTDACVKKNQFLAGFGVPAPNCASHAS